MQKRWCNAMHDLKSRINFCSILASASLSFLHFFSSTPPLTLNIQKVTHYLPEEVEEAWDDNRDMAYNPEEEDHSSLFFQEYHIAPQYLWALEFWWSKRWSLISWGWIWAIITRYDRKHMTRIWITWRFKKFQENRPLVERWKVLEIYEYEVPLGTNIYIDIWF